MRFAPEDGWKLPPIVDVIIRRCARRFKLDAEEWRRAPNAANLAKAFNDLEEAARKFADALESLAAEPTAGESDRSVSAFVLSALLGDAMLRTPTPRGDQTRASQTRLSDNMSALSRALPPDGSNEHTIAFWPEIDCEGYWLDGRQFLKPTLARARAIEQIARDSLKDLTKAIPDMRGSGSVLAKLANRPFVASELRLLEADESTASFLFIPSQSVDSPKLGLALDCAWLVLECFGLEAADKIVSSTTPAVRAKNAESDPPFLGLVKAMFRYAGAEKRRPNKRGRMFRYAGAEEAKDSEFDAVLREVAKTVRSDVEQLKSIRFAFPLTAEIARTNRRS